MDLLIIPTLPLQIQLPTHHILPSCTYHIIVQPCKHLQVTKQIHVEEYVVRCRKSFVSRPDAGLSACLALGRHHRARVPRNELQIIFLPISRKLCPSATCAARQIHRGCCSNVQSCKLGQNVASSDICQMVQHHKQDAPRYPMPFQCTFGSLSLLRKVDRMVFNTWRNWEKIICHILFWQSEMNLQ